jgi:hypothetical protein
MGDNGLLIKRGNQDTYKYREIMRKHRKISVYKL